MAVKGFVNLNNDESHGLIIHLMQEKMMIPDFLDRCYDIKRTVNTVLNTLSLRKGLQLR